MRVRITKTITMQIGAATRSQLARQYNVHYKTFANWLKMIPDLKINPRQKVLTPNQVAKIYEYLGAP